jgi:signal transduction histidine kinase
VRTLSLDLRPAALDELGLVATLRAYIPSQAARAGIKMRFEADTLPPSRNGEAEIACFHVVQEAMTNVIRHAKASSVEIELRHHGDDVRLLFHDDGIGFDVALATAGAGSRSFGLLSMSERTQLAGGRFLIASAAGRGTRIEATFPW